MTADVETLLGAFGLTLKNVAAGAVASFAALRFFDGMGRFDRWSTFVGGWAAAAWGAPPLTAYFELSPKMEVGVVLLIGFFGMAIGAELFKVIRSTDWRGLVGSILRREPPPSK